MAAVTAPTRRIPIPTSELIARMVQAHSSVSDLIFSPGRKPQVESSGKLIEVDLDEVGLLTGTDTGFIAADLVGANRTAALMLKEHGSADVSYSVAQVGRFRVNIFKQRGTYAAVLRVIATRVPTFEDLRLPEELARIAELKNGLVLVTGPTGSGKSSTLAAILDLINSRRAEHIITIEDPIEFVYTHKKATIHQRELHSDTDSFASALRAALRQAPTVILVGEMRDRETIDVALTAAETGHVVLSTLHTIDASKTVDRLVGTFPLSEQTAVRNRIAASFRYFVAQRLIPRADGRGRIAAFEILKSTLRTRGYVSRGESDGRTLLDAMRDGDQEGMQHFDGELEKLAIAGTITTETALQYATNPGNLELMLADLAREHKEAASQAIQ